MVNWNNDSRWVIINGLNLIPDVGGLVGSIVGVLWPASGESVWSQIENQVEQLVEQEISQTVYGLVQGNLQGLQNNVNDYLNTIQQPNPNPDTISQKWNVANGNFELYLPNFQYNENGQDYRLLLLPLFAQFANLHLSLLRDGVLFGKADMHWQDSDVNLAYKQLTDNGNGSNPGNIGITPYTNYANQIYQMGLQNVINNTPVDGTHNQPFLAANTYARQMTLSVLDYVNLWPYFDAEKYPNAVSVYLNREIFSDPQGTSDNSSNPNPIATPPNPPPTQPLSAIQVASESLVLGVQVTYPAGGGPNGETQTPVMGYQGGGTTINVTSSNPIKIAAGRAGDIVNGFQFYFEDTTETAMFGGLGSGPNGAYAGGTPFYYFYLDHILSSVYVHGASEADNCADCVVFGFQLEQSQAATLDTMRLLYVTSPKGVTLDNLATSNRTKVDLNQLKQVAATNNWDAQRQEYWQHMQAQVANQSHQ